jgi:hypothetical protein
MKFVERSQIKNNKYQEALTAIGKLTGDNALELTNMEYDNVISLRTMIWATYGSGSYRTKYNKGTKEMTIWKSI